jgi:hypothetical protein
LELENPDLFTHIDGYMSIEIDNDFDIEIINPMPEKNISTNSVRRFFSNIYSYWFRNTTEQWPSDYDTNYYELKESERDQYLKNKIDARTPKILLD